MGLHKKIRDLSPLVLYTFDRLETYVDFETGDGYCVNKTEYDFPILEISNSYMYYRSKDTRSIVMALSEIENNTKYNALSSGRADYITLGINDNSSVPPKYTFTLNNSSTYGYTDLTENADLYIEDTYSIYLQLSGTAILGISARSPYHLAPDYLNTQASFGFYSKVELSGGFNSLGHVISSFGHTLMAEDNILVVNQMYFGLSSYASLTIDTKQVVLDYPYPFYYGASYSTNKLYEVFRLNDVAISARRNSTGILFYIYNTESKLNMQINVDTNDILAFTFVVSDTRIKVYCNERTYEFRRDVKNINHKLHVGIETKWIPTEIMINNIPKIVFENTSPDINVTADNIALYNREITLTEHMDLYYSNFKNLTIFKMFGFTQLYDFSTLYDTKVRYIEDNVAIPNMMGGSSYLKTQVNYKYLPYIIKNNNTTDFEYSFKCTKYASIQGNRNINGLPISILTSNIKTLMFMFKTSDQHGMLFSNSVYESPISNNISILMSYGYAEIWVGGVLRSRVSEMSNNEWHIVFIIFDAGQTIFYIDQKEYYRHQDVALNTNASTLFGNAIPGNNDLECEFALIGVSTQSLDPQKINLFLNNTKVAYSARGQITLNNVAVGTNVFIYNRLTGQLIEKVKSELIDGTFVYTNRFPYTITVIVADSTLINGKSYIVDPVEIE